jgi:exonuclease SbcD
VDTRAATTLSEVVRLVGREFEQLLAQTPDAIYLSVRVCLTGRTAAHGELFGLEHQLREEILGQAAGQGTDRLWLEKVRIETEPLAAAADLVARSDAMADLQKFLAQAPQDAVLLASLLDDLRPLVDRLPLEVMQALPELDMIRSGDVGDLVRTVTPGLLAYLATAH